MDGAIRDTDAGTNVTIPALEEPDAGIMHGIGVATFQRPALSKPRGQ
jgi:hypothetical protein